MFAIIALVYVVQGRAEPRLVTSLRGLEARASGCRADMLTLARDRTWSSPVPVTRALAR
jgi:hypothetical protein